MSSRKHQPQAVFNSFIKIQPSYAVGFMQRVDNHDRRYSPFKATPIRNPGKLSRKARGRMRSCFQWLMSISSLKKVYERKSGKSFWFKLSFITLNLTKRQDHTDEYIKEHLLQPFLRWMQRHHQGYSYIWKAEINKRGTIHFHITTNRFIHYKAVRMKWNSLLQAHGYLKDYTHENLIAWVPSTEIKAVAQTKKLLGYIHGYFSKKDELKNVCSLVCPVKNTPYYKTNYNWVTAEDGSIWEVKRKVVGRLWGASNNLVQSSLILEQGTADYADMRQVLETHPKVEGIQSDHCWLYKFHADVTKDFPHSVRKQLHSLINLAGAKEDKQTYFEIESLR